jgi:very-short-patch-repair endonuclease
MPNQRARDLRRNLTNAERRLWSQLRLRQIEGHRFRRQRPVGPYVVDFICLEQRLVIEVDGGQHAERTSQDAKRDAWLRSQGYRILRYWNNEVLSQTEGVVQVIMGALGGEGERPPS